MNKAVQTKRARGIDRAIDILNYIHELRQPASVGDIAKSIAAPRSSTYELVQRLVDAKLLESYDSGRVFFGRAMHYYGMDYVAGMPLIQRAQDEISCLANRWGETAQYCGMDGNKYTVILMDVGRQTFRLSADIGVKVPLPWTASGRLLLGDMSDNEIFELIPPDDFVLPDGGAIERDQFLQEVRDAKRNGYCCTEGLVNSFSLCMAAPVKGQSGHIVGTICFMATLDSREEARAALLEALIDSGKRLSTYRE